MLESIPDELVARYKRVAERKTGTDFPIRRTPLEFPAYLLEEWEHRPFRDRYESLKDMYRPKPVVANPVDMEIKSGVDAEQVITINTSPAGKTTPVTWNYTFQIPIIGNRLYAQPVLSAYECQFPREDIVRGMRIGIAGFKDEVPLQTIRPVNIDDFRALINIILEAS